MNEDLGGKKPSSLIGVWVHAVNVLVDNVRGNVSVILSLRL